MFLSMFMGDVTQFSEMYLNPSGNGWLSTPLTQGIGTLSWPRAMSLRNTGEAVQAERRSDSEMVKNGDLGATKNEGIKRQKVLTESLNPAATRLVVKK